MLYVTHNVFERDTYSHILTDVDVTSRYTVTRPLRTKKKSEVAFLLAVLYKKVGVFKSPKTFQCDNGSEFKRSVK